MTTVKFSQCSTTTLTCLLAGTLSGCITVADPWVSQLPEVSGDNTATLTGRSVFNPTDIAHEHILRVNGALAGKFNNDEVKTFQIPAGPQSLTLTCHSYSNAGSIRQLPNYNAADGKTKMDINPQPGDELCIKITYSITNCAVLEDVDPSYCTR